MLQMERETTDEQHTYLSFSVGTASKTLTKKLNINWIQLNSKSNDLASSSPCLSLLMPLEANRTRPTEAELCLLICSLFPIDFSLPIEDLVVYGTALKLFGDIHDIGEGRNKTYGLIKIINHQLPPRYLNKLCLWEDKYGSQFIKVFRCVKDLAKSIASKYQLSLHCNEFVKGNWPKTNLYEYFYGLSLVPEKTSNRAINLEYLQLALLQLQHREDSRNSVVDIFDRMKESMILSLDVPSLPESLNVLCNLRTLRLNILKLEDMSWIGCLMNLELLSISTPCLTDIPKEMGQLGNLRLLDLRKMSIAYIPPGVLSRMLKLEELYFPLSFRRWGLRAKELGYDEWEEDDYDEKERVGTSNDRMERINASISDITSLALHALEISIPDASVLPENSSMFNTIRRFKISVPNNLRYRPPGQFHSKNLLQLTGEAYNMKVSGICKLMSRTEVLSLLKVRNLMNVTFQLHDCGCSKLQNMIVSACDELEYIVHTMGKRTLPEDGSLFSNLETLHLTLLPNLKQIWHGRLASLRSFENLSYISIRFCNKLKYVFPLSIVKGSTRLKSIQVIDCIEMDGIFYQSKEDDKDLVCYSIEELQFHSLPKLVGFLIHMDDKISEVQDFTDQSRTTNEIASTSVSSCMLDGNSKSFSTEVKASRVNERCIDDAEVICRPPISVRKRNSRGNAFHQFVSSLLASFTVSKDLTSCKEKYVALISSKLAEKWMRDLKILEIAFCDALQIIFSFEENHVISGAFNSLIELKLIGLRNLVHIWFDVPPKTIAFQNLQVLVLSKCHNMYIFSPRVAKLLVHLQKIYINRCEKMEQVVLKEYEEDSDEKIVFPRLRFLEFESIPNLKVFYCGIHPVELPLLESLKLNQCNKMEYFSYKSVRTPVLKRILINGGLCALMGDLNTTLKRCMRNCSGTPADDDDPSSTVNACALVDDFDELRNIPNSDDEFDGHDELDGLHEIDLPDSTTTIDISGSEANEVAQSYLKEFTFDDLKIATNNFNSDALLGKGGFGNVYKGWLDEWTFSPSRTRTGMAVAIKKMKSNSTQGFHEWQSEVYFLERLCHQNLIKLLGYCREDEEFLLVYEFMQRGSLGSYLFRGTAKRNLGIESLSWELRLKIAIGAARGLFALHNSEMKVIHRDFTPSNILLDRNYNAKISDFGLAKLGPSGGDSHVSTRVVEASEYLAADGDSHVSTRIMGTYGYAAPEYVATGHLYVKSDVYGFGVVLLELLTGLRALDTERPNWQQNLADWLQPIALNKRKFKKVMDTRIKGQYSSKAMMLTAQLSFKCLKHDPKRRPSMKEVLEALEQIDAITKTPQGNQKFQFLKILKFSP